MKEITMKCMKDMKKSKFLDRYIYHFRHSRAGGSPVLEKKGNRRQVNESSPSHTSSRQRPEFLNLTNMEEIPDFAGITREMREINSDDKLAARPISPISNVILSIETGNR